jgi:small-conductance mechanosensitive channel
MSPVLSDFPAWLVGLMRPTSLIELAVIATCVLLAYAAVRGLRGPMPRSGSVWFGDGVVGGVLFPLLLLATVALARFLLKEHLPGQLLGLAIPVFVSLAAIRLTVKVLGAAFPSSAALRAVERWFSWAVWLAAVLWITGLMPALLTELDQITWKIGSTPVSLRNILEGIVAAVVVLVGALWLSAALETQLLKGATDNLSLRKMAANALRALLLFIGLMFALSAAGIDLTALGVLGGALGVGIGFGLQKLAANYVSGFVILAERSMRIGDMVRVDNFEGRITDISTRYTVIRALNGREAIVPNEMMLTQRVENSSLADSKVAQSTTVLVAYGTDLQALMPRLAEVVRSVPRVVAEPAPTVLLSNFAADGLELTVNFWFNDPETGGQGARSDVNLALLRTFSELGVEIPFPQRVLQRAGSKFKHL